MCHHISAMWKEIKRKFFHLTALIYVVGLVYLPRPTYLALLRVLFVLELAFELARVNHQGFNRWFTARYGGMLRDEEKSSFSGVFWMLLGVQTTVALVEPVPLAATALLYLILGDTVASLIGMRLGGPHWPGSKKRLSGSIACFAVCLFIGVVLLSPAYGWPVVVIGALAATFLETLSLQINDNFLIPVGSSLVLITAIKFLPLYYHIYTDIFQW